MAAAVPITSVKDAIAAIYDHEGRPEDFRLRIGYEMLDPVGLNMAIVCDAVLKRGWMPDGSEDLEDCRVYRYVAGA